MFEPLFRGKRTDNGEWIKGILFNGKEDTFIIPHGNEYDYDPLDGLAFDVYGCKVDPETVSQFTGLIVANGKVFDGDILKFGYRILLVFWNSEAFQWQARSVVSDSEIHRTCGGYHDYNWTITDLGWIDAEPILTGDMTTKIIGNKWDNLELLTRSKERCNNAADGFSRRIDNNMKIRVIDPKIVVSGNTDKPYYSIEYYNISDERWHIGYSSYNLKFVKEWLNDDFETVEADVSPVRHGRWLYEVHKENVNFRWNVTAECSECCDNRKEIWGGFFPNVPDCIARDVALQNAKQIKLDNYCPNCGTKMDKED